MGYAIVAALILVADRLSKYLVMANMAEGESVPLIPPFFYITYVQNRGAAFGFFQGQTALLSAIAVVCLLFIFTQWNKIMAKSAFVRWGVVTALAGAVGNLIDRLRWGAVIDFADIRIFVFNVADAAIVLGVALLFWEVLIHDRKAR
ncbi:MAG: signal peptidase II [Bacillota bacterium]|nr:signal peptidase II [Bacillota bacterium]NLJ03779.1 signal peptidase II [Bacillota bacterium]